ncbi:MAG: 50S ribosomal protein L24 [Oscillospiraceae bacterium]|jgi:large subunit ribosomal protein L24|nr:50S ribosomal protein L24 [Oscillospiraceae bacterium]MCI2205278.1 50S ribosomal protein L24 [Oscillospiraceae bacterium]
MENKMHVKTGDTVAILSGRDTGKQGKVMAVSPKEGKVIVEKLNMVTKHVKPRRAGEEGGIVKAEGAIYASKVQIVCPHCKKLTRVGHKVHDEQKPNGGVKHVSERVCKKCGETL